MTDTPTFTAVVLAGSRPGSDPVAEAAGVSVKALALVGHDPMLIRVLQTLAQSHAVGTRIICGPPEPMLAGEPALTTWLNAQQIQWITPCSSPSASAGSAMRDLPAAQPVLLTTADHALLTSEIVDTFCRDARTSQSDVVVGVVREEVVRDAYPASRRTITRLKDGGYCGCNLFAFLTPAGRNVTEFWRRMEQNRKRPLRLIQQLGWGSVLRYAMGRLTLPEALDRLSQQLAIRISAVTLPFADAAVDVDTPEDLSLVRSIVAQRQQNQESTEARVSAGPHAPFSS